jgi:hypothetical protein
VLQTKLALVVRVKTTNARGLKRSNNSWPIAGLLFAAAVLIAIPISVQLMRTGELSVGWGQAFADGPDSEDRVRVYRRSHRHARRFYRRAYRIRPYYYSCVGYFGPGCCGAPEPCRRGWIR